MADWKKLPDIQPATSWKDLPDAPTEPSAPDPSIDPGTEPDLKRGNFGTPLGRAKAKERVLGNVVTFFGNGGPTAIMKGASAAMKWPQAGPDGRRADEGPIDLYRRIRDETKSTMRQAERNGPQVEVNIPKVGLVKFNPIALAGAAAPSLLAPNPTGVLERLILGGALGTEGAAIQSDADLTRGEVVPFLKDLGKGALFGAGAAGVAEGLSAPMRMISRGAGSRVGDIAATQAAKDAAAVEAQYGRGVIPKAIGDVGEAAPESLPGRPGYEMATERIADDTQRLGNAANRRAPVAPAEEAGMRMGNASQRGFDVIEGSRFDNMPPPPEGPLARFPQEATPGDLSKMAGERTRDFFAEPISADLGPAIGQQVRNAGRGALAAAPAAVGFGASSGRGAIGTLIAGAGAGLAKGAPQFARSTLGAPRVQAGALEGLIQASQAAQKATQAGARSTAAVEPTLEKEQEDAIQAFLGRGL